MDKITKEQAKKYLKDGAQYCPFCGSKSISAQHPELTDAGVDVGVVCYICNKEWIDVYELTSVVNDDGSDPEEFLDF